MRFDKAPTGQVCSECNTAPAKVTIYVPGLFGAFCPGCCYAWLLEALRSKRITMQQLADAVKSQIDEMTKEQLLRLYMAFANEGLIKDD